MLALHRPTNHRDIPKPDLLNPGRQQFRLRITGMPKLVPPFRSCAILSKDPVHASHRSQVNSFFQQGGVHFPDGAIRKPLNVQRWPEQFPFLGDSRHEEPFWACEGHKTVPLPCHVDKKSLGIHSDPHRLDECSSSHRLP